MSEDFFLTNGPLGENEPENEKLLEQKTTYKRGEGPTGCGLVIVLWISFPLMLYYLI